MKLDEFNSFTLERTSDEIERFSSFKIDDHNEKEFLHQILPYLYSAIKKRFNCEDVTQHLREVIYKESKQQIWMTDEGSKSTFNSNFILTYLLSNSESRLRITLMNLLKTNYPIPMYFKQFKSIYSI